MSEPRYSPVEMIKALVAFDTTSRDSNLDLIRFVEKQAPQPSARRPPIDHQENRRTS
jgi:hypothetical protein